MGLARPQKLPVPLQLMPVGLSRQQLPEEALRASVTGHGEMPPWEQAAPGMPHAQTTGPGPGLAHPEATVPSASPNRGSGPSVGPRGPASPPRTQGSLLWGRRSLPTGARPAESRDAGIGGVLLRPPLLPNCQSHHRPPGRSGLTYLQERTQVGMTDTLPGDQRGPGTRGELALERLPHPRRGGDTRLTHSSLLHLNLDWTHSLGEP